MSSTSDLSPAKDCPPSTSDEFLLKLFMRESSEAGPLCSNHPRQFEIFRALSETDVNVKELSEFGASLRSHLDSVVQSSQGIRDIEKKALRLGTGLNGVRSSPTLAAAWKRLVDVPSDGVVDQFHEVDFCATMASWVRFMWACRPLPGKRDDAEKSGELTKDSTAWTWDSLSVEQQEKVK